jgi:hypothetical protein
LTPTDAPSYGIVPGTAAIPLGQITLPVTFGTAENFRTEYIKFEVADFETSYHAIFERPALAKFMETLIMSTLSSKCQAQKEFFPSRATSNAPLTATRRLSS